MSVETWSMAAASVVTLIAGLALSRSVLAATPGWERILWLGPGVEAAALALFAAEHFLGAHDLMVIVPRWLPGALFWTYFAGAGLLAAAISLIAWKGVRWSAPLLALFFLLIVTMVDLPGLASHVHERLFWTLTLRETVFAAGALVLAGSVWPRERAVSNVLIVIGRRLVGCICIVYAVEHFLFPRFVPGVPLEKLTPAWMPAPALLAYFVGVALLVGGAGLLAPRRHRLAAVLAGSVLLLLTALFYVPILLTELHSPLALEGLNYVGDTLLFAATILLAGFDPDLVAERRA